MKKISIITIFDNTNFGTYLQVVALGCYLKWRGFNVEVIRYFRPFTTSVSLLKRCFYTFNPFRVIKRLFSLFFILNLRRKNHDFVKKHINLSFPYTSYKHLLMSPPEADLYLTGSDQVWNSIYNRGIDKAYFLDFVFSDKPKASYAASIGMEQIDEEEIHIWRSLLEKYKLILVREKSAVYLLNKLGLKSEVVLDPTLLLNKTQWLSVIGNMSFKKSENYLLIYSVETRSENLIISEVAKKIAKERNLKIYGVYYGDYFNKIDCCDRNFYYSDPKLFLSLMYHADFIVISSFHGTAFSINFNKDFITVSPNRFSSRIDSLLDICDLKERKITNNNLDGLLISQIDYEIVNKRLDDERAKSFLSLSKILSLMD